MSTQVFSRSGHQDRRSELFCVGKLGLGRIELQNGVVLLIPEGWDGKAPVVGIPVSRVDSFQEIDLTPITVQPNQPNQPNQGRPR